MKLRNKHMDMTNLAFFVVERSPVEFYSLILIKSPLNNAVSSKQFGQNAKHVLT